MYKGNTAGRRVQVMLDVDPDSTFQSEEAGNRAFYVTEGFNLGEARYYVADVSIRGDWVMLVRGEPPVDDTVRPFRGQYAREIIAPTLAGDTLVLSEIVQQRYVMLDFWGTWCAPCIGEIPYLKEAYDTFGPEQFEIVGIALDLEDGPALEAFIAENEITWPQLRQKTIADSIITTYQVREFPVAYLINPSGEIVATDADLRGKKLHQTLERLLSP